MAQRWLWSEKINEYKSLCLTTFSVIKIIWVWIFIKTNVESKHFSFMLVLTHFAVTVKTLQYAMLFGIQYLVQC